MAPSPRRRSIPEREEKEQRSTAVKCVRRRLQVAICSLIKKRNTKHFQVKIPFQVHFEHLYVGHMLVCDTGIWLHTIECPAPVPLEPV